MGDGEERRPLGNVIYSLADRLPFFKFFHGLSPLQQRAFKLALPFLTLAASSFCYGPGPRVQDALGIFICIAMLLTFESLPLPVTALLVPVLLTLFGVLPGGGMRWRPTPTRSFSDDRRTDTGGGAATQRH
jgi:di/tricarboxylate transporter